MSSMFAACANSALVPIPAPMLPSERPSPAGSAADVAADPLSVAETTTELIWSMRRRCCSAAVAIAASMAAAALEVNAASGPTPPARGAHSVRVSRGRAAAGAGAGAAAGGATQLCCTGGTTGGGGGTTAAFGEVLGGDGAMSGSTSSLVLIGGGSGGVAAWGGALRCAGDCGATSTPFVAATSASSAE